MLFFSLMCFNIYTNEVVTFAEAAETVEIKLQPMKHSMSGFQAEERGGSKAVFSTIKQKNMGKMPANIFGDQGNLSLNHFREQLVLLMGNKR